MPTKEYEPHKSSIGDLDANIMAILCYIGPVIIGFIPGLNFVAWLVPLVLFFIEKQSEFVKFHAAQCFALQLIGVVLGIIVSAIGGVLGVAAALAGSTANVTAALGTMGAIGALTAVVSLVIFVFAIIAIVNAYKYKVYRIPLAAVIADKLAALASGNKPAE